MDVCDNESNDENSSLLFLLDERCATPRKDKFSCHFAVRGAVSVRTRKKADGGRPTLKETRSSEADPQTQFCKQLSKVVDFQTYDRRRMVAPGHFVVETNGKQCDVWQEGAR